MSGGGRGRLHRAQREGEEQADFLRRADLELEQAGDGDADDDEVGDDVHDAVCDEGVATVDAFAGDALVPVSLHGNALECRDADRDDGPGDDEGDGALGDEEGLWCDKYSEELQCDAELRESECKEVHPGRGPKPVGRVTCWPKLFVDCGGKDSEGEVKNVPLSSSEEDTERNLAHGVTHAILTLCILSAS